jgi:hypothetical protein
VTALLLFLCTALGFALGYAFARKRKVVNIHVDADVKLLDEVLKLDRALYHENDWLDHKSKDSPHIGIWAYREDDGRVHVDNRMHGNTKDDNRRRGASFAEALLALRSVLVQRAAERVHVLEEAAGVLSKNGGSDA